MDKLNLIPDNDGYSPESDYGMVASDVTDLYVVSKRFVVNEVAVIQVRWTVGETDYEYLYNFYTANEDAGGAAFLIDLILWSASLTEYVAKFMPGSFSASSRQGTGIVVTASLVVQSTSATAVPAYP